MNRKSKIIVSVIGITIVLLALLGITYAYYLTRIEGNTNTNSIGVTTANLNLVYSDNSAELITSNEPIIPGSFSSSKTFTVTNNGNASTEYVVVLENMKTVYASSTKDVTEGQITSFVYPEDFRYILTCVVKDKNGILLNDKNCTGMGETGLPINGGVLTGNVIEQNNIHEYSITVNYVDSGKDQSEDMNKRLEGLINIRNVSDVNPYKNNQDLLANRIIDNATNITEEQKEAGYAEFRTIPISTPAVDISLFEYTGYVEPTNYDRYQTISSYSSYFVYSDEVEYNNSTDRFTLVNPKRGYLSNIYEDIKGKYVLNLGFRNEQDANYYYDAIPSDKFLFKIFEPTDSNTIYYGNVKKEFKSLENTLNVTTDEYGTTYYYRGKVTNNFLNFNDMCWRIVRIEGDGSIKLVLEDQYDTCEQINNDIDGDGKIYTGNWDIGIKVFNIEYKFSQYETTVGGIKDKLNDWLNNNINSSNQNKLKSTKICFGDWNSAYDKNTGKLLTEEEKDYKLKNWESIYYKNGLRLLSGIQEPYSTYLCDVNGKSINKYKIYPLTVDEILYAGSANNSNESSFLPTYYLLNDYQNSNSLQLLTSSSAFYDYLDHEQVFFSFSCGDLGSSSGYDLVVRPSISILSEYAKYFSGDGSQLNPYVIQ